MPKTIMATLRWRLLEVGADKALVDYAGKTAHRYAETRRHTRVIALLRDRPIAQVTVTYCVCRSESQGYSARLQVTTNSRLILDDLRSFQDLIKTDMQIY